MVLKSFESRKNLKKIYKIFWEGIGGIYGKVWEKFSWNFVKNLQKYENFGTNIWRICWKYINTEQIFRIIFNIFGDQYI